MSNWQCSHCLMVYSFDEWIALPREPLVPEEAQPTAPNGHGYTAICRCGKPFHRGKWCLRRDVGRYSVSTVHLELDHSFHGPPIWYETMIFGLINEPCWRYRTREEAIVGHKRAVRLLFWLILRDIFQRLVAKVLQIKVN